MSRNLTIKNIVSIIEAFAQEHLQINKVLKGNIFDIDLEKYVSGVYFIWDITAMNGTGTNGLTYSLDIFVADNVSDINTYSNEVSVQNECTLIAQDFLAVLRNYNATNYKSVDKDLMFDLADGWSLVPFKERFDSMYAGTSLSLNITTGFSYNRCVIPMIDAIITDKKEKLITDLGEVIIYIN